MSLQSPNHRSSKCLHPMKCHLFIYLFIFFSRHFSSPPLSPFFFFTSFSGLPNRTIRLPTPRPPHSVSLTVKLPFSFPSFLPFLICPPLFLPRSHLSPIRRPLHSVDR